MVLVLQTSSYIFDPQLAVDSSLFEPKFAIGSLLFENLVWADSNSEHFTIRIIYCSPWCKLRSPLPTENTPKK